MRPRLVALWLGVCVIGACERRVEEPSSRSPTSAAPNVQQPAATTATTATTATKAAKAANEPPPALAPRRCTRPTPEVPSRPAPPQGPDPACPPDPTGRPKLRWAKVVFEHDGTPVDVEVAEQQEHRTRGLMYRTSMPESEGMLFVFAKRTELSFWMKNTCIALDMLFIDHDGLIVGIEENVPTLNKSSYRVGCESLYVVELNAGWSRRHGVKAGQKVRFVGL